MSEESLPVVEQRGLWYEELRVGARYRHSPGRTISEADNTFFSALTMNQQALHVDEVYSAEQEFGGRLVNSMMTLAMVVGLSVNQLTQRTMVANLGFSEVTFPAPLRHGDTLRAETVVVDKRPSKSRPGQGVVTLQHVGYNQRGDVVVEATRTTLWRLDPR
ncbi:MAG: MaoC family dehydratase [Actinomycetes bacterium]|jgi:acyl dehydratase